MRLAVERREDRRERAALQPRRRLALRVGRCLHVHRRHRVIVIVMDVVLAAPRHLHRLAELLRKHCRFRRIIGLRFASERAAQQRHVAGDVLRLDPHHLRDGVLHGLRILRRRPDFDFAVLDIPRRQRAAPSAHAPASRRVVFRLVRLRRAGERLDRRRPCCAPLCRACATVVDQLRFEGIRIVVRVGPEVPIDLELLAALHGRPGIVGNHRHAAQRLESIGFPCTSRSAPSASRRALSALRHRPPT